MPLTPLISYVLSALFMGLLRSFDLASSALDAGSAALALTLAPACLTAALALFASAVPERRGRLAASLLSTVALFAQFALAWAFIYRLHLLGGDYFVATAGYKVATAVVPIAGLTWGAALILVACATRTLVQSIADLTPSRGLQQHARWWALAMLVPITLAAIFWVVLFACEVLGREVGNVLFMATNTLLGGRGHSPLIRWVILLPLSGVGVYSAVIMGWLVRAANGERLAALALKLDLLKTAPPPATDPR